MPPPIIFVLVDIVITQTGIEANEWVTGQQVKIAVTNNSRNLVKLEKHNNAWLLATEEEKVVFDLQQRDFVATASARFQYQFFWKHEVGVHSVT